MTLMMGQSNDWFYAPDESGIELFKAAKPSTATLPHKSSCGTRGPKSIRSLESALIRGRAKRHPTPGKQRTVSYKRSRTANRIRRLRVLCASQSSQHSSRRNVAGRAAYIGMAARPDFLPPDHQLNIFNMCQRHRCQQIIREGITVSPLQLKPLRRFCSLIGMLEYD